VRWCKNSNYDPRHNGERRTVELLAEFCPKVVFDVGANIGEWTEMALKAFPEAVIYAFEIAPATYATLQRRIDGSARVRCMSSGLWRNSVVVELRYYPSNLAFSTTSEYPHALTYQTLKARVVGSDELCRQHDVGHIDFLKIDVEGAEPEVLEGFCDMFSRGAIDVVQFEYDRVNILTKFLLLDFYRWFEKRGYMVGKVYPTHVDFRPYVLEDEDFLGPTYLACRTALREQIDRLSGSRSAAVSRQSARVVHSGAC
jgi:FkbM family methyltransferase